ncbi:MAG: hypothetical protein QG584_1936 [Pseudomonadota bacterium]|nr:hypothetical protein [Pseudomonadota bacterium]
MDRRKFLVASCASMIAHAPSSIAFGELVSGENATTQLREELTICVVGIGPLGANALLELGPFAARPQHTSLLNIRDLDVRHLCIDRNGKGLAFRYGCKPKLVDVLSEMAALDMEPEISLGTTLNSQFIAVDIVFVVADFDIASANRSAQAITRLARRSGAFTVVLGANSSTPPTTLNSSLHLQGIEADAALLLQESRGDHVAEQIRMIATSAATSGLIGVDTADIAYALSGGVGCKRPGMLSGIAIGIGEGPARAKNAATMAAGELDLRLPAPDGVFVKISAAGRSLRIAEIDQVLHIVRQRISQDIFLIAASPVEKHLSGTLKVEILTSRWSA